MSKSVIIENDYFFVGELKFGNITTYDIVRKSDNQIVIPNIMDKQEAINTFKRMYENN